MTTYKLEKLWLGLALIVITSLALIIRVYKLGIIPPGLSWDEANNGYSGYMLLKTGKDEWGNSLPIYSKRFGDYSSEIYAYFAAIAIKLFGLNVFAVRLPSAIMGSVMVLTFYFLLKNFFKLTNFSNNNFIPLIGSLLLAINPWNIHYSRHALEANLALSFAVFSLTLIFAFLVNRQYRYLYLGSILGIFSIYTYYNARLVVPLLFIIIFIFEWKKIISNKLHFIFVILLGLTLLTPFFLNLTDGKLLIRQQEVSLFTDPYRVTDLNKLIQEDITNGANTNSFWHNKIIYFGEELVKQVFRQLSPRFLFVGEDSNLRYGVRAYGKFLYPEAVLIILGLVFLLKQKRKWIIFFLSWVVIAILPAILSNESPHPFRAYFLLPLLLILSTLGVHYLISWSASFTKYISVTAIIFCYLITFGSYWHYYLVHFPKQADFDWQAYYKPVIDYLAERQDRYNKILFTTDYNQPHIFLFFYQKIDPLRVQLAIKSERPLFTNKAAIDRFENYRFVPINWSEAVSCNNCLVVDSQPHLEILNDQYLTGGLRVKRLKTFYLNNGSPIFYIFQIGQ